MALRLADPRHIEIDPQTQFAQAFTKASRVTDLNISICIILMAEAYNTGPKSFIRNDIAALKHDRLTWTDSNYIRDETIRDANAILVSEQADIPLADICGGREAAMASKCPPKKLGVITATRLQASSKIDI
ncbi:Tn3 family transposase [Photorhabdus temperata]